MRKYILFNIIASFIFSYNSRWYTYRYRILWYIFNYKRDGSDNPIITNLTLPDYNITRVNYNIFTDFRIFIQLSLSFSPCPKCYTLINGTTSTNFNTIANDYTYRVWEFYILWDQCLGGYVTAKLESYPISVKLSNVA